MEDILRLRIFGDGSKLNGKEFVMAKKYLLVLLFTFVGLSAAFAKPLNTETAADCIRQIRHFIDGYDNYFKLYLVVRVN
jgi:hypothetical protein